MIALLVHCRNVYRFTHIESALEPEAADGTSPCPLSVMRDETGVYRCWVIKRCRHVPWVGAARNTSEASPLQEVYTIRTAYSTTHRRMPDTQFYARVGCQVPMG